MLQKESQQIEKSMKKSTPALLNTLSVYDCVSSTWMLVFLAHLSLCDKVTFCGPDLFVVLQLLACVSVVDKSTYYFNNYWSMTSYQ